MPIVSDAKPGVRTLTIPGCDDDIDQNPLLVVRTNTAFTTVHVDLLHWFTMAAEVAAGLWAAEEVVSTGAQVAIAGYMLTKPTMPLKATFTQIATSSDDDTK